MKCYICAEQGKDSDAVAICIVCGMGVCMEHLVREEVELWRGDYPFPAKKLKKPVPRILCVICHEAYEEG
ncbi:Uncharacterized conserved protein UCP037465, zinc finger protein, AF1427 [Ferroglobus placidus DSM 10642]|uniref:Uncharacterized conserved protein UCP037465, zinc finger protein, AF1427 n=1 Tax=Ferroglobus placidus (strain DSM 10642 / AEDII12DO) TaxID=589924 RepID=D3RYF6_FERPA|nr:DUF2180 family protein [Ferroglobus placidus]ADC65519.1 Uncharacterized conserved protein UCP037465, zinc finger protein, AF1427 [Ferroglobus placidus DSM 10642]